MSANKEKKIKLVKELSENLSKAKSAVLTDYKGLNVAQINQLRSKLKTVNAKLMVIKNTLLQKALANSDYQNGEQIGELLLGPTALILSFDDEILPIKELDAFIQINDLPKIKGGFLNKRLIDSNEIKKLAKLPPKEILFSQLTQTIAAPISGLATVLEANIKSLIYILDQKSKN